MNQFLLFFLLFISMNSLVAQNIIPNGDFEEDVICSEYNLNCGPFAWRLTSSEPPNYYSGPVDSDTAFQTHWSSFIPFSYDNQGAYREYLQVPILCPMEKGKYYFLSFQIRAKEVAVKEIEVMFNPIPTITAHNQIIVAKPSIKFINENFWYNKEEHWITISTRYMADGSEKYMLIGNFQPQLLTEHKRIFNTRIDKHIALYYIDNVILKQESNVTCDYAAYLSLLHTDRRRHSLSQEIFFPVYPPIVTAQSIEDSSIVTIGKTIVLKNIFFDVNRDELLPASFTALNKLLNLLQQQPELMINIDGHTDITGLEAHNEALSVNRAKAVAQYLQSKGIHNERITITGFASTRPVATNDSAEGRQANRRVEFTLHHADK